MADAARSEPSSTFRDMGEYLSQLATLAAGSIVVLATFSESGSGGGGGGYAVVAVVLFAASILAALLARIALIFRSNMTDEDSEKPGTETFFAWSLTLGLTAFALGVVALAIYAAQRV